MTPQGYASLQEVNLKAELDRAWRVYRKLKAGEALSEEDRAFLREQYELLRARGYIKGDWLQGVAREDASHLGLSSLTQNPLDVDALAGEQAHDWAKFLYYFYLLEVYSRGVANIRVRRRDKERRKEGEEREEEEEQEPLPSPTPGPILEEGERLDVTLKDARAALIAVLGLYRPRAGELLEDALKTPGSAEKAFEALGYLLEGKWDRLRDMGFDDGTIAYFRALIEEGYITQEALSFLKELYREVKATGGSMYELANRIRKAATLFSQFLEENSVDSFGQFTSFSELGLSGRLDRLALNYVLALNYREGMVAYAERFSGIDINYVGEQLENGQWDWVEAYEYIYKTVKERIGETLRKLQVDEYGVHLFNALEESNADIAAQAFLAERIGLEGLRSYLESLIYLKQENGQLVVLEGVKRQEAMREHIANLAQYLTVGLEASYAEVDMYVLAFPFNLAAYIPDGQSVLTATATVARAMDALASSSFATSPKRQYLYIGPGGRVEEAINNFMRDTLHRVRQLIEGYDVLLDDPAFASIAGERPEVSMRSPEDIANIYRFRISRYIIRPQDVRSFGYLQNILPQVGLDPYLLQRMQAGELGEKAEEIYSRFFSLRDPSLLRRYMTAVPVVPTRISKAFLEELASVPRGPVLQGFDVLGGYAEAYWLSSYLVSDRLYAQGEFYAYGVDSSFRINLSTTAVEGQEGMETITTFDLLGKDILYGGWGGVERIEGRALWNGSTVTDATLRAKLDAMGGNVVVVGAMHGEEKYLYIYMKKGGVWIRGGVYKLSDEEALRFLSGLDWTVGGFHFQGKVITAVTETEDGRRIAQLKGLVAAFKLDTGQLDALGGILSGETAQGEMLNTLFVGLSEDTGREPNLVASYFLFDEHWKQGGTAVYVQWNGLTAFGMKAVENITGGSTITVVSAGYRRGRFAVAADYLERGNSIDWGGMLFLGSVVDDVDALVTGAVFTQQLEGEEQRYGGGIVSFTWGEKKRSYFHYSYTKLLEDYTANFDTYLQRYTQLKDNITYIGRELDNYVSSYEALLFTIQEKVEGQLPEGATVVGVEGLGEAYTRYKAGDETVTFTVIYKEGEVEKRQEVTLTAKEFEAIATALEGAGGPAKEILRQIAILEEERRLILKNVEYYYLSLVREWFHTLKFSTTFTWGSIDVEGLIFKGDYGPGYLVNTFVEIDRTQLQALISKAGLSDDEAKRLLEAYGGGIRLSLGDLLFLFGLYSFYAKEEKDTIQDVRSLIVRAGLSTQAYRDMGWALMGEWRRSVATQGDVELFNEAILRIMALVWRDGPLYSYEADKYYLLLEGSDGTYHLVDSQGELDEIRRKGYAIKGGIIIQSREGGRLKAFRLTVMLGRTSIEGQNLGTGEEGFKALYNQFAVELGLQERDLERLRELLLLVGVVDLSNAEVYFDDKTGKLYLVEGDKVLKLDLRFRLRVEE